jgi:hypothetical protein
MTGTRDVTESERRRYRVANADIEAVGEVLIACRTAGRLACDRQEVAEVIATAAAEEWDRTHSKASAARAALDSMQCGAADLKTFMGTG